MHIERILVVFVLLLLYRVGPIGRIEPSPISSILNELRLLHSNNSETISLRVEIIVAHCYRIQDNWQSKESLQHCFPKPRVGRRR